MQTIDNFNFAGKKAFVRVDFNVPLDENFHITDDTRILIIASHMGRPKRIPTQNIL